MGVAQPKSHCYRVEERKQMEALGHEAPKFPSPQLITKPWKKKKCCRGSKREKARFLEEVAFDCTCSV